MDLKLSLCIGLFLILTIIATSTGEKEKKKLKLVMDKLNKVKDPVHILKSDLTFDKGDDEGVKINGQVEPMVEFNNDYKITIDIYHASDEDGEFKKVVGVTDKGICDLMANQYKKYIYDSLKNYSNAPDPDICPVPIQVYTVNNYSLDSSKIQKYLLPGYYKNDMFVIQDGEVILHYEFRAHTEEE